MDLLIVLAFVAVWVGAVLIIHALFRAFGVPDEPPKDRRPFDRGW